MTFPRTALLAAAFFASSPLSQAVTFLIDFGTNSPSAVYPGPETWNAFTTSTIGTNLQLNDTGGNTTSIRLNGTGTINQGGSAGAGTSTYDNATTPSGATWYASTSSNAAAGDWFYTTTTAGQSQQLYTFTNLTAGDVVSLDVFSSRNNTNSLGRFSYSLDGGTTWTGFGVLEADGSAAMDDGWDTNTTLDQNYNSNTQGYGKSRYMNASDVTITGTSLIVRARDVDTSDTYAGINAMRLTVIPEPTSAFLALSGLALSAFRRRR